MLIGLFKNELMAQSKTEIKSKINLTTELKKVNRTDMNRSFLIEKFTN